MIFLSPQISSDSCTKPVEIYENNICQLLLVEAASLTGAYSTTKNTY